MRGLNNRQVDTTVRNEDPAAASGGSARIGGRGLTIALAIAAVAFLLLILTLAR